MLLKEKVLAVDVENLSKTNQMRLTMHISSGSRKEKNFREAYTGIGLNPGEKRTMRMYLPHKAIFEVGKDARNLKNPLDTDKINAIEFKMIWPYEAGRKIWHTAVSRISVWRGNRKPQRKFRQTSICLFIDAYGQVQAWRMGGKDSFRRGSQEEP
ncbi:MAG: hypothetical protein V8T87_06000 [Victivallales bacterium]